MLNRIIWSIGTFLMLVAVLAAAWFVWLSPYRLYIVYTGSMDRTIPPGSAVVVHTGQYHVGQVVSFTVNNEVVTHRLLSINTDGTITTKGDANRSADSWHPPKSNIIGGVVTAPNHLGWFLVYLRQPGGIASVLAFCLCLWLLFGSSKPRAPAQPAATA